MRGFGARLIAYDPYVPDDVLARSGVVRADDLDTVFRESDVVQLFARLTPETERFIGSRHFALMKPTACFVNTARSRLVDTDALHEALVNRRIAGAGLDVHDQEPLPVDSPWRSLDNVTITTHYAGDDDHDAAFGAARRRGGRRTRRDRPVRRGGQRTRTGVGVSGGT